MNRAISISLWNGDEILETLVNGLPELMDLAKELSAKEFRASFRASDELRIDGDVVEELLAPYRTETE